MLRNPYRPLEKNLGYRFRRKQRLKTALTHPSFRYETLDMDEDNQRLEFLGDAVLGMVAGAYLFEHFPDWQEGDLTQMRSRISNTKILSHIGERIGLGPFLLLGRGEKQTGGDRRASNLSDAMEAVLGAAFVDGGLSAAKKIFNKLFAPEIRSLLDTSGYDNAKGTLQELCQQRLRSNPRYRLAHEDGPAHSRIFTVEVIVQNDVAGIGSGRSKREAEMEAAREALKKLGS